MHPSRSISPVFDDPVVRELIRLAVREDLGAGDVTSEACIPQGTLVGAQIVAREAGVVAGLPLVPPVLCAFGARARVAFKVRDGAAVKAGRTLVVIEGPARGILAAERTILNFLQRLSGIATLTRRYVDAVAGTRARIYDTRKTTPGWRALEKYAVRVGGGTNHRMGLYDEGLVKDNHLAALRSQGLTLKEALSRLPGVLNALFCRLVTGSASACARSGCNSAPPRDRTYRIQWFLAAPLQCRHVRRFVLVLRGRPT